MFVSCVGFSSVLLNNFWLDIIHVWVVCVLFGDSFAGSVNSLLVAWHCVYVYRYIAIDSLSINVNN